MYLAGTEVLTWKYYFVLVVLSFLKLFKEFTYYFGAFFMAVNLAGAIVGLLVERYIPTQIGLPLFGYFELSRWVAPLGKQLMRFWPLLAGQFMVLLAIGYINTKVKSYKWNVFDNIAYNSQRNGRGRPESLAEFEGMKKGHSFWKKIDFFVRILGWTSPFVLSSLGYIAQIAGHGSFADGLSRIGNLTWEEDTINYLFSLLDMTSIPFSVFSV